MKLIVCVDNRGGMAFNHRRQSRDRVLTEDIVKNVGDARLVLSPYSLSLFDGYVLDIAVSSDPFADAGENDFCFVETASPTSDADVSELILYHWNRDYPSDTPFLLDTAAFLLVSTVDFVGFSHEKITKEVWKK